MEEAKRIIYVCSNHKLPSKNIMDMSLIDGEEQLIGTDPFFPTRVIPVDISPHSLRCELVILLERLVVKELPEPRRFPPRKPAKGIWTTTFDHPSYTQVRGRGLRPQWLARREMVGPPLRGRGFPSAYRSLPVRDSLYPPPLRGNLYENNRRGYGNPGNYEQGPPRPYGRGRQHPPFDFSPAPYRTPPRREFDNGLNRYSEFRRDVEDAIDSSYSPRGHVSQRLAMANAMLEQGMRLASEAMAEDYRHPVPRPPPPPPPHPYLRRGRGSFGGMRNAGMSGSSWDDNSVPTESWRSTWDGDDFEIRPGGEYRSFGGPPRKPARGLRGGKNLGTLWRR